MKLERFGQRLVSGDDPAEAADGLPPQQRRQGHPLLALRPKPQRVQQHVVGRLVLALDERVE